jgi:hypothetical protein
MIEKAKEKIRQGKFREYMKEVEEEYKEWSLIKELI